LEYSLSFPDEQHDNRNLKYDKDQEFRSKVEEEVTVGIDEADYLIA
jgi:hypothetical protein